MGKTPGKWLLQEYPPPAENVSLWWVTGSRKIEYISMYGTEKCLKVPQLEPVVADLQEFEAAWSMQGVPGKPRLYSKTLSSKNGEKIMFLLGS